MRVVLLLTLFSVPCFSQVITTVAGNTWVFSAGGPAINTPLGYVSGVAVDAAGNVYLSAAADNVVVKVNPAGIATIVAGNTTCGSSGDGGPGTSAALCFPNGLAVDAAGNLYIADTYNQRVRRLAPDGTISTVAGNGNFDFSGDGGPAVNASFKYPYAIAVDTTGNLYISDGDNRRIRKVATSGTISTFAGTGTDGFSGDGGPAAAANFSSPRGLAFDAAGNLYVADNGNDRVRKITPTGSISTYAGGGSAPPNNVSATAADLGGAFGIAFDASGNLYVSLNWRGQICKISFVGTASIVAGTGVSGFTGDGGPALAATFNGPGAIAVDQTGNLYIADSVNSRVRKLDLSAKINTIAGNGMYRFSGDGGAARSANLNGPAGLALDGAGNLYISDNGNNRIRKITPAGVITTIAGNSSNRFVGDNGPAALAELYSPAGLAVDNAGNLLIADSAHRAIRSIAPSGIITTLAGTGSDGFSGDGGPATAAKLFDPPGVALDATGNIYIADIGNNRVRKITKATGIISTIAGTGTAGFSGDGGPAIAANLNSPWSVTVDPTGNVFVADAGNHRVRKITAGGTISTVAGNGVQEFSGDGGLATSASLDQPRCVLVDAAGNLYICDYYNYRVRRVTGNGIIATVAGGGDFGDGYPATQATLERPTAVALDTAGNLYIAHEDKVRKVLTVPPSFSLAPTTISFNSPAGVPGIVTQQVAVNSVVTGLEWTVQTSTTSGGGWLAAAPVLGKATCISRITRTTGSAGSLPTGQSPPLRAVAHQVLRATTGRAHRRRWDSRTVWPWMPTVTFISATPLMSAS